MRYLMVDGQGDPNTAADYADALAALYPVAFALKFISKNDLNRDYVVPPLEGLWWADDMSVFTSVRDKPLWEWTMMILVLEWIETAMVSDAINKAGRRTPLLRSTACVSRLSMRDMRTNPAYRYI